MNSYDLILDSIQQQLDALDSGKQLLILHPYAVEYHGRVILSLLDARSCLVSLSAKQSTWEGFLPFVAAELEYHLHESLGITHLTSPEEALQSVWACLGKYETFTFALDNYDHVADPQIDEWLLRLLAGLPPSQRVVISGRAFHTDFLQKAPSEKSVVLPHLPSYLMANYFSAPENLQLLEVHALGPSQTTISGRTINTWDGVLPKSLFYFLVDRGMTTRTVIFENFWPTLEKQEATNVFHVTKRKVNEMIQHDLMKYGSGYYWLDNRLTLQYDVVLFQEAVQTAEVSEETAQAHYEQALRLYRGHFLSDLDHTWIVERREELQQVYSDALLGLGSIYWRTGEVLRAEGLLQRACVNLPAREDTTVTALRFCWEKGNKALGLKLYQLHRHALGEQATSEEISHLAEKLRSL